MNRLIAVLLFLTSPAYTSWDPIVIKKAQTFDVLDARFNAKKLGKLFEAMPMPPKVDNYYGYTGRPPIVEWMPGKPIGHSVKIIPSEDGIVRRWTFSDPYAKLPWEGKTLHFTAFGHLNKHHHVMAYQLIAGGHIGKALKAFSKYSRVLSFTFSVSSMGKAGIVEAIGNVNGCERVNLTNSRALRPVVNSILNGLAQNVSLIKLFPLVKKVK